MLSTEPPPHWNQASTYRECSRVVGSSASLGFDPPALLTHAPTHPRGGHNIVTVPLQQSHHLHTILHIALQISSTNYQTIKHKTCQRTHSSLGHTETILYTNVSARSVIFSNYDPSTTPEQIPCVASTVCCGTSLGPTSTNLQVTSLSHYPISDLTFIPESNDDIILEQSHFFLHSIISSFLDQN